MNSKKPDLDLSDPVAQEMLNSHDELNESQINEFKAVFAIFDKDGGGTIDAQELGSAMRSLGQNPSLTELDDMIRSVDVDGSGTIDFPEFLNMMACKIKDADNEEDLVRAFQLFDKDRTGRISAQELKLALSSAGEKMSKHDIDFVFQNVEVDPDGCLDYRKFAKFILS